MGERKREWNSEGGREGVKAITGVSPTRMEGSNGNSAQTSKHYIHSIDYIKERHPSLPKQSLN